MLGAMEQSSTPRRRTGQREDGAATRLQILEAAGQVFAEKGVARTTGKEIAARAGTKSAAVNYYFGGVEALYTEVLIEAHHRLLDYEAVRTLLLTPASPREKLAALLDGVLRAILGPGPEKWPLRVLAREILQPSAALPVLVEREILPKKRLIHTLVADFLGVAPDHPAVSRSMLHIVAPSAMLVVSNPDFLREICPPHAFGDLDAVVAHFQAFVAAGLTAIAARIGQEG